jgi:hypothetical protein
MTNDDVWVVDDRPGKYKISTIRDGYLWDEARGLPVHRVLAIDYVERVRNGSIFADEHVHHIDGIKSNNDPKNLIILHKWIHLAIHATIAMAPYLPQSGISPRQLRDPDSLVGFLQEAGVPFIWLGGNQ